MNTSDSIHYEKVAAAIAFIKTHFKEQPSLEQIAAGVHLSPFHFQRLFTEWAGTSPKKFLQYISLQYAKQLLQQPRANIAAAAYETGLSGTGRLHDLFVTIEGMTPAEYRNGASQLIINYRFSNTIFGCLLIATTHKGVCFAGFHDEEAAALRALKASFPHAALIAREDRLQQQVLDMLQPASASVQQVKLHLKASTFQLKVWAALLNIPTGQLTTYGRIADTIQQPAASRAVGTAIGSNPVAFLIPCHRVIQATGHLGGYRWGTTRKTAMIAWEIAQTSNTAEETGPLSLFHDNLF